MCTLVTSQFVEDSRNNEDITRISIKVVISLRCCLVEVKDSYAKRQMGFAIT